jgi:hypothetical protein
LTYEAGAVAPASTVSGASQPSGPAATQQANETTPPRPNLRALFTRGVWRGMCIQTALKHTILSGFLHSEWTDNYRGRIYWDSSGANVRIYNDRIRGWQMRIQNGYGNYLAGRGYVGTSATQTHWPLKKC